MASKFKRIVLHWTGGGYLANYADRKAYHFVIEGSGRIVEGRHAPEDNLNCNDKYYAAHVEGGNTGSIGIAIACRKDLATQPKRKQVEAMCKLAAELCKKYGMEINSTTVVTHCEIDPKNKIDINNIPCMALYGAKNVADELRKKVKCYYNII